ncbi:tRNA ligase [Coemansia sp. RSA 1646]|nr:tRNA ligase [Coemansia sp. RSA 1646]KAJ2093257.1 trna ligase [Coemansia sp. RSA 986]
MVNQANVGPVTPEEKYELRQLMRAMKELSMVTPSSKRKVRQTKHTYDDHTVTSWKCNEFMYKKDPCPLPTLARGLFTSGQGNEETVVARGYNKFFNVGEVPKTKWPAIISDTRGPYELTVKENGCLILAAALDDGKKLLVTSKHAVNVPHAEVGMQWMGRHLASANKTPEEFAAFLHENNATAVYELCDDGFEEHILEYPERTRGLYLHGINRNSSELDTWASSDVTKVAEEFGFHNTKYFTFDTAEEGKEFADKVRKDHVLDGRAIEGFVVRCRTIKGNQPFMFKIKYDEPYLMFREWREVTNRIRSGSSYRTNYPLTKRYAAWVKEQIKSYPEDFEEYNKQKGIIAARKRFLAYYESHGGSEADVFEQAEGCKKTLIMPIATIGCGKTTVSLVLSKLFGFGHVQNDNITTKPSRVAFHREILDQFDDHSFVIADRNNHLQELRKTLKEAVCGELHGCRVVALYWDHDNAFKSEIMNTTTKRVLSRGEAHQSLTPQRTKDFRRIMHGFVTSFAPLDQESEKDVTVDEIIELDPLADSSVNVRTVINGLCDMFPDELKKPTEEEIDQALDKALEFKPSVRKVVGKEQTPSQKQSKKQVVEFVGLVPRGVNIGKWLTRQVAERKDVDWDVCQELMKKGKHISAYHITLAHKASIKEASKKEIYDGYIQALHDGKRNDIRAKCEADYIVCNGDVMALRVKSMAIRGEDKVPDAVTKSMQSSDAEVESSTALLSTNAIPHITLCIGPDARAMQSNDMLKAVFGPDNADSPQNCPSDWTVIPVTLLFNAVVQKFMTKN